MRETLSSLWRCPILGSRYSVAEAARSHWPVHTSPHCGTAAVEAMVVVVVEMEVVGVVVVGS